jgi:hypothetical protein
LERLLAASINLSRLAIESDRRRRQGQDTNYDRHHHGRAAWNEGAVRLTAIRGCAFGAKSPPFIAVFFGKDYLTGG